MIISFSSKYVYFWNPYCSFYKCQCIKHDSVLYANMFREMLMWTQKKFVVLANGEHEVTGVQFNVFFFRWLPFSILASVSNESF